MDYYTFYAGTAFDVWKDMGAHVTNDGTTFTVYAPNARSVSLIGEFNNWQPAEMERTGDGRFYTLHVKEAHHFQMYKYRITGADGNVIDHSDPFAFYNELRPGTASRIYDMNRYVFHDDLSEGLTLNRDSIKVYVENDGSRTEIPQGKYTVRQDAGHQEDSGFSCDFEIAFADIKAVDGVNAASKIIVEYTAELNSDAIIGSAGNPNEVYLEFSNNPYDDGTGNTPEDKVIVFTFEIIANKVDEKHEPLNGAGFTLYKYNKDEGDYVQIGEELKGMTTFTWSGLDAGQYRVVETTVPDGYNKADDILFTVEATYDTDAADPGFGKLVIKDADGEIISDGENPVFSVSDGSASTDIVNTTTPKLPETGGIGTGIFYGVGAMLMAGGVLTMIIRRRQRSIHE